MKFVIIDYGVGNFRNVQKAFEAVGAEAEISESVAVVKAADALILPGVGAFGDAIDHVRARQLDAPILDAVKAGKPLIGICVGLQLLFESSEEIGQHVGLGILSGQVKRFPTNLTVPHMGWNQIEPAQNHPLLKNIREGSFAYFAHSYHAVPTQASDVLANTDYGQKFSSVLGRDNVCAIQFHPEKSQKVGLQMLRNFVDFAQKV